MLFAPNILLMKPDNSKKGVYIHSIKPEVSYHLCPRCFPYIDLYCEVCEGHGEYPIIESEKNN